MSKPAPTLLDELYRVSFEPGPLPGWRDKVAMRNALQAARRFVADDRMSAFMADLSNEAFLKSKNKKLNCRILDSLRVSARLPHESIWIEYNLQSYQKRSIELHATHDKRPDQYKDGEVPEKEGWLIQQHPAIPTACIMYLFLRDDVLAEKYGYRLWTFAFPFAWVNDDSPLPWHSLFAEMRIGVRTFSGSDKVVPIWASEVICGLAGYRTEAVGCVDSPLIIGPERDKSGQIKRTYMNLLIEWQGAVRRVWALLATLDHLPILKGEVRQSKGFLARGRIRKFLDHQTITLNVPAKRDTRVIARQAIAQAHRKRHEVRGHWRDDWRNPPSGRCPQHLWVCVDNEADHIVCELCRGRQIYVHKHERGDASLGYVTHDYAITHDEERTKA